MFLLPASSRITASGSLCSLLGTAADAHARTHALTQAFTHSHASGRSDDLMFLWNVFLLTPVHLIQHLRAADKEGLQKCCADVKQQKEKTGETLRKLFNHEYNDIFSSRCSLKYISCCFTMFLFCRIWHICFGMWACLKSELFSDQGRKNVFS